MKQINLGMKKKIIFNGSQNKNNIYHVTLKVKFTC